MKSDIHALRHVDEDDPVALALLVVGRGGDEPAVEPAEHRPEAGPAEPRGHASRTAGRNAAATRSGGRNAHMARPAFSRAPPARGGLRGRSRGRRIRGEHRRASRVRRRPERTGARALRGSRLHVHRISWSIAVVSTPLDAPGAAPSCQRPRHSSASAADGQPPEPFAGAAAGGFPAEGAPARPRKRLAVSERRADCPPPAQPAAGSGRYPGISNSWEIALSS